MGKVEKLIEKQGDNMRQSVSRAAGVPGAGVPARKEPKGREKGVSRSNDAFVIEIGQIVADPDQPRKEFDPGKIEMMAESLKARGQIQPISARFSQSLGKWVIVAGERR